MSLNAQKKHFNWFAITSIVKRGYLEIWPSPCPKRRYKASLGRVKRTQMSPNEKKLQRVLVHSSTDLYYERLITDWGSLNTGPLGLAMLSLLCTSRDWNSTKETCSYGCSYNKCNLNCSTSVYLIFWQRQYITNSLTSIFLWRHEMVLKFYGKQY